MSTFKGFKISGIDTNKLPLPTGNQPPEYTTFYLSLTLIGGYANLEIQALWGYEFSKLVENWNKTGESLPRLEFFPVEDYFGEICASETTFKFLESYTSHIKGFVEKANEATLRSIQNLYNFRQEIRQFNATHFGN